MGGLFDDTALNRASERVGDYGPDKGALRRKEGSQDSWDQT